MNTENVQPSLENREHLAIQNMNTENVQPSLENRGHLAIQNTQPLALEYKINCNLCTTPTYFGDFEKLARHIERFHADFDKKERTNKRKRGCNEEYSTKRVKWGGGYDNDNDEEEEKDIDDEDNVRSSCNTCSECRNCNYREYKLSKLADENDNEEENESGKEEEQESEGDDNDSEIDDHDNETLQTFIKGDEIYKKCDTVKLSDYDDKLEVDGRLVDIDCIEKWDDDNHYKLIGVVYRYNGEYDELLYWVRGSLFLKCNEKPEYKGGYPIINGIKRSKTDVEKWGDEEYYYKYIPNSKLNKWDFDNEEEEEDIDDDEQINDVIQVLKYIKSMKGDYQGFVEHANSRDIHTISECCYNLIQDNIPLPKNMKRALKVFLIPMGEEIITLANKNECIEKKRKLLSQDQVGHGIFTLLASTILPAIISAFVK